MFYKHIIINSNTNKILYLFVDFNLEISSDLFSNKNSFKLKQKIYNYLLDNNIDYEGFDIYFVVNDLVIGKFDFSIQPYSYKKILNIDEIDFISNDDYLDII